MFELGVRVYYVKNIWKAGPNGLLAGAVVAFIDGANRVGPDADTIVTGQPLIRVKWDVAPNDPVWYSPNELDLLANYKETKEA